MKYSHYVPIPESRISTYHTSWVSQLSLPTSTFLPGLLTPLLTSFLHLLLSTSSLSSFYCFPSSLPHLSAIILNAFTYLLQPLPPEPLLYFSPPFPTVTLTCSLTQPKPSYHLNYSHLPQCSLRACPNTSLL